MLNFSGKDKRYDMDDLLSVMDVLRRQCPWDREQTHKSIRMNFIEEAYEACDAIDKSDDALLCEELGDVLLQVVFHSRMAAERGAFTFEDVTTGICKKLIFRHPHIYSDVNAETPEEVLRNWDSIKLSEKGGGHKAAVQGVAKSLPALMRAEKLAGRASRAGVPHDISEVEARPPADIGEQLFTLAAYARKQGINPEQALTEYCDTFVEGFNEA